MSRKLTALVELGVPGGRTGCRTHDEAMAVARAVAASKFVALSGLECYEGLQITGDSARDTADGRRADAARARTSRSPAMREGLFAGPSIILTAGGSAAFDIVARELPMRLSKPVLTILRSGCYVTHDSGFYNRMLERRQGAQRRRLAVAPGPAAGARSVVASAILPRAGAGDPDDGQARRVVRPRHADRPQSATARSRRRAAARAGIVEDCQR